MSVHLSFCPYESVRLPLDGFSWNLILKIFTIICRETSNLIQIGKILVHILVVAEWEIMRKDVFKLCCVFYDAHSACRNLWPVRIRAFKLRVIWWRNNVTVQTQIILSCLETIHSGSYATIVNVGAFCVLSHCWAILQLLPYTFGILNEILRSDTC